MKESAGTIRQMRTAEANELSELYLLDKDLRHANRALKLAFSHFENSDDENDRIIWMSLIRDSIVTICACLHKDEPYRLDIDDVFQGQIGYREFFQKKILELRDTAFAHRVGLWRQCEIVTHVQDGRGAPCGSVIATFSGYDDEDKKMILSFVGTMGRYVETKIAEFKAKLDFQIAQMAPDQINALSEFVYVNAANKRASRRKHKNSFPK